MHTRTPPFIKAGVKYQRGIYTCIYVCAWGIWSFFAQIQASWCKQLTSWSKLMAFRSRPAVYFVAKFSQSARQHCQPLWPEWAIPGGKRNTASDPARKNNSFSQNAHTTYAKDYQADKYTLHHANQSAFRAQKQNHRKKFTPEQVLLSKTPRPLRLW